MSILCVVSPSIRPLFYMTLYIRSFDTQQHMATPNYSPRPDSHTLTAKATTNQSGRQSESIFMFMSLTLRVCVCNVHTQWAARGVLEKCVWRLCGDHPLATPLATESLATDCAYLFLHPIRMCVWRLWMRQRARSTRNNDGASWTTTTEASLDGATKRTTNPSSRRLVVCILLSVDGFFFCEWNSSRREQTPQHSSEHRIECLPSSINTYRHTTF